MKKVLLLLLAAVMLFSIFACTKNEGNKPATTDPDVTTPGTTTPGTTTPGTTVPGTTVSPDITVNNPDKPDLELMTFNGKKLRISSAPDQISLEVFADETAVNIRDQAVWERNAKIEELYDVKISPVSTGDGSLRGQVTTMSNWIISGDDFYDLALSYAHTTGPLLVLGYLQNWNNFKYTDFSKFYWMNDVNDVFTVNDAIYTPVGEMCISVLTNTFAVFYNRTKGDQLFVDDGMTTITEAVIEKIGDMEWTMDYFMNIIADIYSDIDYEAGPSDGDFYGYAADILCELDIWQFAFDIPMVKKDAKQYLKCVFNTEKTNEMVDKLMTLYWETPGSYISSSGITATFVKGRSLFFTTRLAECFGAFKEMEDNYLILPYPLWDENQEKYMTGAMDNYNVLSVPISTPNVDMVSYLAEVLNYETRETVFPVYYEESLQKQYSRDPLTIEMLEIIMNGRNFDIATMFHTETGGLPLAIRHCVGYDKMSFAEKYAEKGDTFEHGLKTVVNKYKLYQSKM